MRYDDIGRAFVYVPPLGDSFTVPEPCSGARSTDRLTPRAVRQIKGAAIKADRMGMGLRTFMTFTVAAEDRTAFLTGELVLGREMKRVLNAFSEWLGRRGRERLVYVWVAENKNDENPHVHLLTNYQVTRAEFDDFAKHVEGLWGFGWVKIERVREPNRAGAYIMKALGYSMKGAAQDQGTVIGNRYGIARAILPRYETLDLFQCAATVEGLQLLQSEMTEDVEELAEGLWLTRYGLAFSAGTELDRVAAVLDEIGGAVHRSD